MDGVGNIFVADFRNHTIRKVTSDGVVSTVAGLANAFGSADGTGNVVNQQFTFAVHIRELFSTADYADGTDGGIEFFFGGNSPAF